jgi:hypothetical protein
MSARFTPDDAAREIVKSLVSSETTDGKVFISTPVMYPSGAHAVVRVDGMNDRWFVSDDGYGAQEADMMGASSTFRRIAKTVADRSGVGFDQRFLFVVEATRAELPGAVAIVANASAEAVRRTAIRQEEIRYAVSRETFDRKVDIAFRGQTIVRQPEISGSSGHAWEFSAGIERQGNIIYLLDLVRPRPNAVYASVSKFTDVLIKGTELRGAAVLADIERTEPQLVSLLSRAAGAALPAEASDEAWRALVA